MAETDEDKKAGSKAAPAKETYEITGIAPGKYAFAGFGEVDLTSLPSDAICANLVKKKFPFIRKK